MVVANDSNWPLDGRIGRVTQGEYEGYLALVALETWTTASGPRRGEQFQRWCFYLVQPHAAAYADDAGATEGKAPHTDDFTIAYERFNEVIDEMGLVWLAPDSEADVEREWFGLRDQWSKERIREQHRLTGRIRQWLRGGRK